MPLMQNVSRKLQHVFRRGRNTATTDTDATEVDSLLPTTTEPLVSSFEQDPSFDACSVLFAANIRSCMSNEHALVCHGIRTNVWDVSVLIDDPDEALQPLLA
jgi:hypothetical protein